MVLAVGHGSVVHDGPCAACRVSQCHCMPKCRSAVVAARNDLTLTARTRIGFTFRPSSHVRTTDAHSRPVPMQTQAFRHGFSDVHVAEGGYTGYLASIWGLDTGSLGP